MGDYRFSFDVTISAADDDEALALAYGSLRPELLERLSREPVILPKPATAERIVGVTLRMGERPV